MDITDDSGDSAGEIVGARGWALEVTEVRIGSIADGGRFETVRNVGALDGIIVGREQLPGIFRIASVSMGSMSV